MQEYSRGFRILRNAYQAHVGLALYSVFEYQHPVGEGGGHKTEFTDGRPGGGGGLNLVVMVTVWLVRPLHWPQTEAIPLISRSSPTGTLNARMDYWGRAGAKPYM